MSLETDLYAWFAARNFPYQRIDHAPTPKVTDGAKARAGLDGGHSKSLLVIDKAKALTLIVAEGATRVDLKGVGKALGIKGRFSFAAPDLMEQSLGVLPGNATPMGLIHPGSAAIARVVVDQALLAYPQIWCHPLRNTASIALEPTALLAFIEDHHGPATTMAVACPSPAGAA